MWTIGELKTRGKAAMKANYGLTLVVSVIMGMITAGYGSTAGTNSQKIQEGFQDNPDMMALAALILSIVGVLVIIIKLVDIFVFNPIEVGCKNFFLKNTSEPAGLDALGVAFKPEWMHNVLTLFLRDLFLVGWTLLFIIPGIVKAYSYRLVPYIMAENPELSGTEAITLSRKMMNGHKWRAFCLDLSFFGWIILSLLTCGILAVLYVNPYIHCTEAELYMAIKNSTPAENYDTTY